MTLSLYILVLEQPIGEMDPRRATLLLTVAAVAAAKPSFVNASIIVSLSYTGRWRPSRMRPAADLRWCLGMTTLALGRMGR